jgi:hypothetical protein
LKTRSSCLTGKPSFKLCNTRRRTRYASQSHFFPPQPPLLSYTLSSLPLVCQPYTLSRPSVICLHLLYSNTVNSTIQNLDLASKWCTVHLFKAAQPFCSSRGDRFQSRSSVCLSFPFTHQSVFSLLSATACGTSVQAILTDLACSAFSQTTPFSPLVLSPPSRSLVRMTLATSLQLS